MKKTLKTKLLLSIIYLKGVFSAYKKTAETDEILKKIEEKEKEEDKYGRIRCPLCQWSPDRSSRWMCWDCLVPENFFGGCGTSWNTFETRGKCPGCNHRWRWTTCLRCYQWSLHEDWYEKDKI